LKTHYTEIKKSLHMCARHTMLLIKMLVK